MCSPARSDNNSLLSPAPTAVWLAALSSMHIARKRRCVYLVGFPNSRTFKVLYGIYVHANEREIQSIFKTCSKMAVCISRLFHSYLVYISNILVSESVPVVRRIEGIATGVPYELNRVNTNRFVCHPQNGCWDEYVELRIDDC